MRRRLTWFVNETPPRPPTGLVIRQLHIYQTFSLKCYVMFTRRSLVGHRNIFSKFRAKCSSYPLIVLIMHIISSEDYRRCVLRRASGFPFLRLKIPATYQTVCLQMKSNCSVLSAFVSTIPQLFFFFFLKRKPNVVAWTKNVKQFTTFSDTLMLEPRTTIVTRATVHTNRLRIQVDAFILD